MSHIYLVPMLLGKTGGRVYLVLLWHQVNTEYRVGHDSLDFDQLARPSLTTRQYYVRRASYSKPQPLVFLTQPQQRSWPYLGNRMARGCLQWKRSARLLDGKPWPIVAKLRRTKYVQVQMPVRKPLLCT